MPSTELETRNAQLATDLKELAQDVVRRTMKGGASAAECVIREGDEFSTLVRLGQVETLKQSGSRAIGIRVFNGQRAASTYSSDFSREGLDRMIKSAIELSKITPKTPSLESQRLRSLVPSPATLIFIIPMFTPFLAKSASTMPAVPRKPRLIMTRASRTLTAVRLMPPPATKSWPTRMDLSASTGGLIVQFLPCPSHRPKTERCSAIIGSRFRAI